MKPLKVIVAAGARPNFMKVSPILRAANEHNSSLTNGQKTIDTRLLHTGQHYDASMSEIFFRELEMRQPDICLNVGSGSHAVQTAKVMMRFEAICERETPDWVIVVGDVNSTMACTLVCSKIGVRVAHVEAGLRSFDRSMPEEINRVVTDSLADLLLTPSSDASENLHREGAPKEKIQLVGNIMIDALKKHLDAARLRQSHRALGLVDQGYVYATIHRPSNVDKKTTLAAIISELAHLSRELPIVLPLHPRTRKMIDTFGIPLKPSDRMKVIEPVGYLDSLCLTEHARLVLTDSGGLQEESTFFRVPCLTLRPNTERPITVTLGSNRLTGIKSLRADITAILNREPRVGSIPPLWDGHTAERVIQRLMASS